MIARAHRVRRLQWRMRTGSEAQAFALRATVRDRMEENLLPALGRAFDRAAVDELIVRIPRLELTLRVGTIEQLPEALEQAVDQQLRGLVPQARRSAELAWRDVLTHYLATGAVSWEFSQSDPREITGHLRAAAGTDPGAVLHQIRATLTTAHDVRIAYLRLLRLLPARRWGEAAELLLADSPRVPGGHAGLCRAAMESVQARASAEAERPVARLAALVLLLADPARCERAEVLRELARVTGVTGRGDVMPDAGLLRQALPETVVALLFARLTDAPEKGAALGRDAPVRQSGAPATRRGVALPQPFAAPKSRVTVDFFLSVSNAGLVLLHPFLPALFANCGLLENDRITDLPRAASLLHWLATGAQAPQEFELGFAKVLLGMRPDQPLEVDAELLIAADCEEGAALLGAVVSYWKALGGTSVDGLRVSFLQRPGFLREEEKGWKLVPESEGFDVLLMRLPWTISMMRFPWMPRLLHTNWQTP